MPLIRRTIVLMTIGVGLSLNAVVDAGAAAYVDFEPFLHRMSLGLLSGSFESEQGEMRLSWQVNESAGDATFELQLNGTGYVAIGFGGGMTKTDMVLCWVDMDGKAHAQDSFSTGHTLPLADIKLNGTDDVQVLGGSVESGRMTVQFQRKLITGDKLDFPLKATGAFDVVYAWQNGAPGTFKYHHKNHSHVKLDFSKIDGVPANVFGDEERGAASRGLIQLATAGDLVTLNVADGAGAAGSAGFPYGSVASYVDGGDGRPLILLSKLERNIINQEEDPRCSLSVHYPEALTNGTDPMAAPRTTLLGTLSVVPKSGLQAARKKYLAKHPMAKMWIDFKDFDLYVLHPSDIYWVGGFGGEHFIGWISPERYLAAKPVSAGAMAAFVSIPYRLKEAVIVV